MIFNIVGNILAFLFVLGIGILIAKSDPLRELVFSLCAILALIALPIKLITLLIDGSYAAFILCLPLQILLIVVIYACFKYLKQYRQYNKYSWWKDLDLF